MFGSFGLLGRSHCSEEKNNVIASSNLVDPQNQMFPLRPNDENVRKGNWVDPEWKFLALGSYVIGLNHTDS